MVPCYISWSMKTAERAVVVGSHYGDKWPPCAFFCAIGGPPFLLGQVRRESRELLERRSCLQNVIHGSLPLPVAPSEYGTVGDG